MYLAYDTVEKAVVAIKHIKKLFDHRETAVRIIRELKVLRMLRGEEDVVQVRDVIMPPDPVTFNELFIVFEMLGPNMWQKMRLDPAWPGAEGCKTVMFQLLRALARIHARGILHRDVKPQNILTDGEGNVKLADFGLARDVCDAPIAYTGYVVSRWYRAPELLDCKICRYTTAVDVWSAGCIFAELLRHRPLFYATSTDGVMFSMANVLGKLPAEAAACIPSQRVCDFLRAPWHREKPALRECFSEGVDEEALDLMSRMLEYDPAKRITAAEAVNHPYFGDLRGFRAGHEETAAVLKSVDSTPNNRLRIMMYEEVCRQSKQVFTSSI